jgi:hypothetical protein
LADRRDPDRIDHPLVEMLRLRMFAIAAGYEDANDCTTLRRDPVFKMAVGHVPESGEPLCSQPTMSRLENAPGRTEIARMMGCIAFDGGMLSSNAGVLLLRGVEQRLGIAARLAAHLLARNRWQVERQKDLAA